MKTKKNLCVLLIALSSAVLAQPVLKWGNGIGSTGIDGANDMIVDGTGNHFVTGYFSGTVDFDPVGTFNLTSTGGTDIFIAKYDVNGNFLWAKGMGGSLNDAAQAVFIWSDSIYITGSFEGTVDFDPGAGFLNRTSNGGTDVFLAKYDNSGNLIWAKGFGGPGNDIGRDIDANGSFGIIITGSFENTVDFDPGTGTTTGASNGLKDIFYSRFDLSGNLVWARAVGGSGNDEGNAFVINSSYLYITGYFTGVVDFDPSVTVSNLTSNGGTDIFITQMNVTSGYPWMAQLKIGGTGNDIGWDIINNGGVGAFGAELCIVGEFSNSVDFNAGAGITLVNSVGGKDAFLVKYTTPFSSFTFSWVKTFGNTGDEIASAISADPAKQLYVTGKFNSPILDVDPAGTNYNLNNSGSAYDVFFGKYTSVGDFICGGALGSPLFNEAVSAITNFNGEYTLTGTFGNTADIDPSVGVSNINSNGNEDIFISKYSSCYSCLPLARKSAFFSIDTVIGACDTVTICVSVDTTQIFGTGPFQYVWYWDDGSKDDTSTTNSFCHTYINPTFGTIDLWLMIIDSCDNSEWFDVQNYTIGTFPSGACFTAPVGVCVNSSVGFNSICSGTATGGIWDFGDGSPLDTAINLQINHTYTTPGTYNVTLYSKDMCQSITKPITIYDKPTANFSFSISPGCPGLNLTANDLSTPGSIPISTWNWDFDYNGSIESTLQNPSYTYPSPGTYAIYLYVSDANGCSNKTVQSPIIIGDSSIVNYSISVGCPCNDIRFSSIGGGVAWLWDFGDGTMSTSPIPDHRYPSPGNYWVSLTATDASGCIGKKKFALAVCPAEITVSTSKSGNNWCLPGSAPLAKGEGGLNFNTTPPSLITGNTNFDADPNRYPATMSNAKTGALQFFVAQNRVYNANFLPITPMSVAGAYRENIIIPYPGNFNRYYVLNRGIALITVVDMTLNSGLGGVLAGGSIPGFVNMSNDISATEKKAPSGCIDAEYWLIMKNSSTSFNIYQVTNSGFSLNSTQTIGATSTSGVSSFSKSGNKFIYATTSYLEIYDFNKQTGLLSNRIYIPGASKYFSISSDDRYLYRINSNGIEQYDLLNYSVPLSSVIIPGSIGVSTGQMELGPDDKIYIRENGITFGVIQFPNNPSATCGYLSNYVTAHLFQNPWLGDGIQNIVPLNLPVIDTSFAAFSVNTNSCLDVSFTNLVIPPHTDTCSWLYNNDTLIYTWNFGDGSPEVITSDTSQIIHTYAFGSNTYIVSLIVDRPFMCTSDTLFQNISVDSLPTISITGTTTICNGSSTILTASGGGTYNWSTTETTSAITVNPTSTTTYTVTTTDLGCTGATTVVVTVNQNPNISMSPSAICAGGTSTLTATGGTDYLWSTAETTSAINVSPTITTSYSLTATTAGCSTTASATVIVGSTLVPVITGDTIICNGSSTTITTSGGTYLWSTTETTSAITVSPTITTTYTVMVTSGSCSGTVSQTVTVNSLPTPGITGATTICAGNSTTLTASGGDTYSWSTTATSSAITISPPSSTTYTVTVTDLGCSKATTISVIVNSIPTPGITGTTTICIGNSTILIASGGSTYSWSTIEITTAITVSPINNTVYTVIATNAGCTGAATVSVSVTAPPTATAVGTTVCEGETINLSSTGGGTYTWNGPNAFTSILQNPTITNPTVANSGTYTVTVSNGSCSDTATAMITVNPTPVTNAGTDVTITPGSGTTLSATGGTTYIWTPTTGLDCDTCASVIATPTATTIYCVQSAIGNCNSSDCVTVTVEAPCPNNKDLAVPNAFSPNADGHNDDFCLQGWNTCIETFTVLIYDRWGEKVFESEEANFCWDGIYRGKVMDPAVFVYYIKATFTNGNEVMKKGNVSLIK